MAADEIVVLAIKCRLALHIVKFFLRWSYNNVLIESDIDFEIHFGYGARWE